MDAGPRHWLAGSFDRQPEWRWLRAEHLAATGRRLDPRVDDDWVALARAALSKRKSGPVVGAIRAAQEIWTGDPLARGELEARLFTAEPLDRVALRANLPAAVVEAYAEVFFAARPMRRATDWLLARAVGYSPFRGFTAPLPFAAWKLAALAGGPLLLDVVIAATTDRPLPGRVLQETGGRHNPADARTGALARLWVAAMGATTDGDFVRVVRERQWLRARIASTAGRAAPVAPPGALIEAFLSGLPAEGGKSGAAGPSKEAGANIVVTDAAPPDSRRRAGTITRPAETVTASLVCGTARTGQGRREKRSVA